MLGNIFDIWDTPVADGTFQGPNCLGPNLPLFRGGQLGPGQLGLGHSCPVPNLPLLGEDSWAPGPNYWGLNLPLFWSGELSGAQLSGAQLSGAQLSRAHPLQKVVHDRSSWI